MAAESERQGEGRAKEASPRPPVRVTSRELMQDRTELLIVHEGREYRLRITQNRKLILTA